MTKFKVGDKVVITGNSHVHGFNIGETVVVIEVDTTDSDYRCHGEGVHDIWYCAEGDIELVSYSPSEYNPESKPSHYNQEGSIKSNGGPSKYYDFEPDWATWNDFADYKSTHQWKEHSFHLGNVGKVLCRWGDKEGTTKDYDARKIVYSGLRTLLMLEGKDSVREYLNSLLEDNQFKTQGETND